MATRLIFLRQSLLKVGNQYTKFAISNVLANWFWITEFFIAQGLFAIMTISAKKTILGNAVTYTGEIKEVLFKTILILNSVLEIS